MTHDDYAAALRTIRSAGEQEDLDTLEASLDEIGTGDADVALLLQLIDEKRSFLAGPGRDDEATQPR
jgi:hypothetical protein